MLRGDVRGAQVDAVPLVFSQLDLEAASVDALAATYELDPEVVERTLQAASREGYVRAKGDVYELTRSGQRASMTRSAAAAD